MGQLSPVNTFGRLKNRQMRKITIIISSLLLVSAGSFGQVFKIELNQPEPLNISSGNDTIICPGHSVILGSDPTAWGGSQGYLYSWSPVQGLDDPTSANPTASPDETTKYILTVVDQNGCQRSESINITIDVCLGINEQAILDNVMIYPNPSSGNVTLSGLPVNKNELKISLINSMGMEVMFTKVQNGYDTIDIDLESLGLPKGVYFFRLMINNGVLIRKVQLI